MQRELRLDERVVVNRREKVANGESAKKELESNERVIEGIYEARKLQAVEETLDAMKVPSMCCFSRALNQHACKTACY